MNFLATAVGTFAGTFCALLIIAARNNGYTLGDGQIIGGVLCILIIWFISLIAVGAATDWGARPPHR